MMRIHSTAQVGRGRSRPSPDGDWGPPFAQGLRRGRQIALLGREAAALTERERR